MKPTIALFMGLLAFGTVPSAQASELPLTLQEAKNLALEANDPSVRAALARARAAEEAAISASSLPDPQASVSVRNLPVDTFSLDREAMTQLHLAVRQSFPRGDTRALRARGQSIQAEEQQAMASGKARKITRDVAIAWHQARFSVAASQELRVLETLLTDLRNAQESNFAAAGQAALQKIYSTELEVALIKDRLASMLQVRDQAVEGLARFIGRDAYRTPAEPPHVMSGDITGITLDDRLAHHPMIMAADARETAAGNKVSLAKEAYKPAWGLEIGYGGRGGGRADFASAMVTFDLPLWTHKRQDPALRAAKQEQQSTNLSKEALLLDLRQRARSHQADIRSLQKRKSHFEDDILTRAEALADATRNAYAAGDVDFAELIRAEIAVVNSRLQLVQLIRDLGIAHAGLTYLIGEPS